MTKRVSATEAKAHFSELIAEVTHGGSPVIIERHGRPVAALVDLDDLAQITRDKPAGQPLGALALVGAWRDVDDATIDALISDIYAQRLKESGRPVELAE